MADLAGKNLGRYELRQLIGRGGMADVYLGYDPHFERDVAVKVFKRQDEEMLRRFIREAQMMAALHNTHLMPIYDAGEDSVEGNPQYYIVMPVMSGGTLRARIRRSPLPLAEVCRYLNEIADALDYIHGQGIIHRDIKSSNVLLDDHEHCYLSDFGIARTTTDATQLTSTGNVLGTVDYVAPELFEPHSKANVLSDLYSLGVLLFEMVTGRLPFSGDTQIVVVAMHVSKPPPLPRTFVPDIPPSVERVMLRALEKNPGLRYQSATELANAFRQTVIGRQTQDLHERVGAAVWGEDDAAARTVRAEPVILPPAAGPQQARAAQVAHSTGSYPYDPADPQFQAYPVQAPQRTSPERKRGRILAILALATLLVVVVPIAYIALAHPSGNPSTVPIPATAANGTPNLTTTAQVNGSTATAQAASNATATAQAGATATVQAMKNATATAIVAPTATVQAQVTATAGVIQTAIAGTPSYADTLTSADNPATQKAKWDSDTTHCVFASDGYHVQQKTSALGNGLKGCIETGYTYTNLAASVDMTVISGHTGGIFFRVNNQALGGTYAGYLFEIDAQGNYKISHSPDFSLGDAALQDWTPSLALKVGTNVKNRLQVLANGNTLDFYVNNVFLKELQDTTYSTGNIAFLATTTGGGADADVVYSNLQVFAK
ncbi:MAG: serine/threonine protein kinase [Ktedonobacteraceae bacterium]|nr:serine/threonine protein kinase [Ktedonobacteraceae bacterium]